MINTLVIKNYALIEDIRVDFNSGLTIITGETGAGKSILLGALALVLGKRADLSSVKDPSKKCIIEAEFSVDAYRLESVYSENDLDYDAHTILRREILPSGKSRAFVNDTPVSLAQLQALGIHLVDIHSQHETLSLSSEAFQMEMIDTFAGNDGLLRQFSSELTIYREVDKNLSEARIIKETAIKELDYHTFLYEELKEANLKGLNQQELEESYEKLNNTEDIQEGLSRVIQLFSEDSVGTLETAKEARISLGKLKEYSSEFLEYWERLNSIVIELEDLSESLHDAVSNVEADPERLFQLNATLQTIYKLQQKHTVATVAELQEIEADLASKIDVTLHLDEQIETLEKQLITSKDAALSTSEELRQRREDVIPKLKEKLENYLKELGLEHAQFRFELTPSEEFRGNGMDILQLLFTANRGSDFAPIKKVASGGELSRIMLSIKAVLTQYKKLPTIIFDEIDTGVSGEIAHKMAKIMSEMSKGMQLFSITHLPQIAAKGEHHLKVYKEDYNNKTFTRLKALNEDERIVEIAQMIGGNKVTDSAIAHAKELLN